MPKTTKRNDVTRRGRTLRPIIYKTSLDRMFDGWAEDCGWQQDKLRTASEQAIRTRHHEAEIIDESYGARGKLPDIWELSLGNVNVVYTVEPHAVVIRGYHWEPDPETGHGGGYYCETAWHMPD